jgi:hypothetical protein
LVGWRTFGLIIQLIHHRQFPLPSVCTFSVLAGLGRPFVQTPRSTVNWCSTIDLHDTHRVTKPGPRFLGV